MGAYRKWVSLTYLDSSSSLWRLAGVFDSVELEGFRSTWKIGKFLESNLGMRRRFFHIQRNGRRDVNWIPNQNKKWPAVQYLVQESIFSVTNWCPYCGSSKKEGNSASSLILYSDATLFRVQPFLLLSNSLGSKVKAKLYQIDCCQMLSAKG